MNTVLLVEDNDITRRLVHRALSAEGLAVVEAADGQSALRAFPLGNIGLVLQDLVLPDISGFELVKGLRALPGGGEVPIVAFSGLLTSHDEGRLSAAGFDDLITKPVEPGKLVQIVRAHLPEAARGALGQFGAGKRILVADDDAVQRKLIAFKLAQVGFEVVQASDGAQALALARGGAFDLVLSDVLMPELDGFSLCLELRKDPALAPVPVVLATNSYVEAADRELALKVGAYGLVHRTPDLRDVLRLLSVAVRAPRLLRGTASPAEVAPEVEREHLQRMMRQLERQVALNAGANQRCALLSVEIAVLKGLSDALVNQAGTDEAIRQALAACFDAGGISQGALFLREGGAQRVVAVGFQPALHEALQTLFGAPALLDSIFSTRATLVLPTEEAPGGALVLEHAGATSAVLAPVLGHGQVRGALLMMARGSRLESGDQLAFAEAVAGQISQSLTVAAAFERSEQAERQAQEQAAVLKSMLKSISDAVMVVDRHGRFIQWNEAAQPLVDLGPRDAAFQPVGPHHGVYAADQITPLRPEQMPLRRALAGEAVDGQEFFFRHRGAPAGTWLSASARPWRDQAGEPRGAVAVMRDVTLEKRTQSQLMASDRMASVGLLAAGVAHEINNPLAAISSNLELCRATLASRGPLTEAQLAELREMVADATEATGQAVQIVRDLKVFSRHELEPAERVELHQVLDSSLRMARNEIRHRALVVRRFEGPTEVQGSASRLGQVFLNLLVNAAQAIPEGRAADNTITVSTRREGQRAVVEITDTGAGMSKEAKANLFTPFFTTKPAGVGTGLGLTICQRIVEGLGGAIEVESTPGRGTCFRVLLPLAQALGQATAAPLAEARPGGALRGRVLVVDDEPLLGKSIQRTLRAQHDVTAVTSAEAALALIREGRGYDVILSDLMMPEQTGVDFYQALCTLRPGMEQRIVFMTGGAFSERARTFLASVHNPRLEKPFAAGSVNEAVEAQLRALGRSS